MNKIIFFLLLIGASNVNAQTHLLSGFVRNAQTGSAIEGVSLKLRHSGAFSVSAADGAFRISMSGTRDTLDITGVGYSRLSLPVSSLTHLPLLLQLQPETTSLDNVVLNTGYQSLPKERVTGSFTPISKALFNQQTGTTVLARLESITNSLYVDRSSPGFPKIVIRGLSTIQGPRSPLIILNDFPFNGNLDDINPNDVENITILKDAAAASIWGAQAGNGVIVITTKKAQFDRKTTGTFSSNVIFTGQPDLNDIRTFSVADNINVERFLFSQGRYDFTLNNYPFLAVSPVVDILQKQRSGLLTSAQADVAIAALGQHDIRDDFRKYVYQKGTNIQEALNLSGGTKNIGWTVSGGWDKTAGNLKDSYDRKTLRATQAYRLTDKLQLTTGIDYTLSRSLSGEMGYGQLRASNSLLPLYTQLAATDGTALPVYNNYNKAFTDTVYGGRLPDWGYYPLTDWQHDRTTTTLQATLLDIGTAYTLLPWLSVNIKYQYGRQEVNSTRLADAQSYFARDLYNTFTALDPNTNQLNHALPKGGVKDVNNNLLVTQNLRGQFTIDRSWGRNQLSAIGGAELRQLKSDGSYFRQYGFDNLTYTGTPVDYINQYPDPLYGYTNIIPYQDGETAGLNRFVSFFGNAAYTLDRKYTVSASGRRDASNLFGASINNKWSPLWSVGAAWDMTKENFFRQKWASQLKFRATYGSSGNADPTKSAFTTLEYGFNSPYTQLPSARISQFYNPELSWERINIFNLAVDYVTMNERIAVTAEYFHKRGVNLFGNQPQDYTAVPADNIVTNIAGIAGSGWDFSVNTLNVKGVFNWRSQLNINLYHDKVLSNNLPSQFVSDLAGIPNYGVPGRAVASWYAYQWAGLDPSTGDPRGIVDGKVSTDYYAITGENAKVSSLQYIGSAQPKLTATLGNTLQFKQITFSIQLTGKFGYYFLRNSINYSNLYSGYSNNADYGMRWQKPGDEKITTVPSMVYPGNYARDAFYTASSVLFSRADQIRLQYITLTYSFPRPSLQVFMNINNVGLLWVKNCYGIDPDYNNMLAPPRNVAFGARINF